MHAKTQAIADAAGVNRGLIYYYFASREQLIQEVFREAMSLVDMRIKELFFMSSLPFREKIGQFIEFFIEHGLKYPYLELFLITEVNGGFQRIPRPNEEEIQVLKLFKSIEPELEVEIKKGTIPEMSAGQFMTNLISLCAYPILAKPLLKDLMQMNEKKYLSLIKERKQLILKLLFRD